LSDSQIRSLMCVPILNQKQQPIGIMQIDTKDGRGRFDQEDLDLLVSVANQISVAVQIAQLHRDVLKQNELERELQFARQVMQALLPETQGTDSGPVRRWAIAVGDVMGKGLPPALLTAKLSAEIRLFLQGETDPARVVTRLNHQLSENGVLDMYITFLLAMLDITNHRLQLVNAGHPCPLIRRHDGRIEELGKEQSGLPLAIQGGWKYETAETTLEPGDVVILYTDGVTDAFNAHNERFGDAGLRS